ncbi:hypothetical protein [Caulobacter sp. BK020]|uniref:hypothetical protein n=1 Tax=Caulobacter sp. BK020 TaxID=2512117 RepID=UPI0010E14901|nr:hypothetical protein [Caulobacter sp. BK020]TCS14543.1 hypothetical protein EV278_107192 [Caulobacter sp. BK020]
MPELVLRPHLDGDLARFVPREDFARDLASAGGVLPQGGKWTLLDFGGPRTVVRGIGGVEPLGDGRWAAWACLADLRPRHWLAAAAAAERLLRFTARRVDVRTIVAIPAPTPQAVRLLKRIGFVEVGEPYMVWEG